MKENFRLLHEKAKQIAKRFQEAQADLIDILQRIDQCKGFRLLGFSSLHSYAVAALGLSDANAYNFIGIARKSNEIPQLKEAIRQGSLTVCKARKIVSVMKKDDAQKWLQLAKSLPKHKLEREVAKVSPRLAIPERSKYVSEDRLQLQIGISEELLKKIKRIQDLLSQRKRKPTSIEEALEEMTAEYLSRHDPIEKAKRFEERNRKAVSLTQNSSQGTVMENKSQSHKRAPLPARIRHQLMLREQGQCSFIDQNNNRCQSKRWLEIDHIIPVKEGGLNKLDNLQLLCFSHHKLKHAIQATQKALLVKEKVVR